MVGRRDTEDRWQGAVPRQGSVKGEVAAVETDAKEALATPPRRSARPPIADLTGGIDEAPAPGGASTSPARPMTPASGAPSRERLADIKVMQTLTESEYRTLTEQHGRLFDAGMGAEAVKKIIEQLDLDELARSSTSRCARPPASAGRRRSSGCA